MVNAKEEKNIVLSDEEILEISHNIHVKYILDREILNTQGWINELR